MFPGIFSNISNGSSIKYLHVNDSPVGTSKNASNQN